MQRFGRAGLTVLLVVLAAPGCSKGSAGTDQPEGHSLLGIGGADSGEVSDSSESHDVAGGGGVDQQALEEAYAAGFEEACEDVWSNSQDGLLYYENFFYSENDCTGDLDETLGGAFADESEAYDAGQSDGYDAAFDVSWSGQLCWGDTCWSRADF